MSATFKHESCCLRRCTCHSQSLYRLMQLYGCTVGYKFRCSRLASMFSFVTVKEGGTQNTVLRLLQRISRWIQSLVANNFCTDVASKLWRSFKAELHQKYITAAAESGERASEEPRAAWESVMEGCSVEDWYALSDTGKLTRICNSCQLESHT